MMISQRKSYCNRVVIVLPVHNEKGNLTRVVQEIDAAFKSDSEIKYLPYLPFVDDGIVDNYIRENASFCYL